MEAKAKVRRYDLDWLRVIAILSVFVFHSGRFFDMGGWHVKNAVRYPGMDIWIGFLGSWIMPIIFVISGASIYYGLGKGGAGKFIKDKVLRLLVPLVVGMFTHVSLQVYFERHTQGGFRGSYFEFLPHYFDGLYAFGGNFAWMGLHLWYLEVLFIFSLVCLPLFLWLKIGFGKRVLNALGNLLAVPGAVVLLAVLPTVLYATMDPDGYAGMRDFGGWPLPVYLLYFLAGFQIIAHDGLQASIRRQRWWSLAAVLVVTAVLFSTGAAGPDRFFGTPAYILEQSLYSLLSWSILLTLLGFAFQSLNFSTPFLKYANVAVLPFYVLHQTIILSVGYFVVLWNVPLLVKYIVIGVSSFCITMALYEFVVRRSNLLRFLFGMKLEPRPQRLDTTRTVETNKSIA